MLAFLKHAINLCYIQNVCDLTEEFNMASNSTVFTNNRSQAVRLPAELRLPEGVKLVSVRAHGNERIISPIAASR